MSGTQPYFDTEPDRPSPANPTREPDMDLPVDVEGRSHQLGTCQMCGAVGPVFEGAVELPDGEGGYGYANGWRCVETGDCRERRRNPLQPPLPTQPDEEDPWI